MVNSNLSETIFVGDSEMARLMRSHDWSQTPFGDIETWPQSLRSSLSICLNSRFPIAIYWGQDSILLYNDAWRPIVGDKHPWALGRAGREVWSEIWDDIGPELASVLATGEGTFHNDELLSMYRFGYTEECFFEYTFNPIQGEGGSIDGVFNIVTETTYRVLNDRRARLLREVASKTGTAKTAEEACVLMAKTLKSDPADIPFALLYLMDQDGSTVRLCGHTEVKVDHSIAPKVVDLTADDSGGWSIAQVAQTAQSQIIPNLVKRFGTLPGSPWSEPPQEAVVLPIAATGQGKMAGVLVAVASPRRRLDDTYLDFFNQIAQQIAMAIANVRSYEEERRRVEQLAELDRAKTVFFSNVSHEFRTPLTLMLSPLEEVLERVDEWESGGEMSTHPPIPPSTLKEQLQLVQRNGLRLQKLVNTLLDFSRIEAGRVEATYEPTDLAAFTAELTSVFRSAIERANLRLIVDCPPLPEAVYVDREMWEKIVLNLLSNAFKFTFEGEIAIGLQWANDRVDLIVRDTGIGIPAAELPHLFERFHRVKGVQGRSIEGSGIGLSLVQELVKLHQGTINVTSTEGAGTCFTLSIPTGTAHLLPDRIGAPRTLASTALGANSYLEEALRWLPEEANREWQRANGGNILPTPTPDSRLPTSPTPRILLADDNADMRDYVRRLLSQQYEVKAVADGSEALSAIRRQVPDLILTDVMMPNLDGFGLLQALRSDPETREVPIIMLSARAGEEARIEGLAAGADDYLTKPFSARELLARVEATLKLAQLRQEVGAALRESEAKYRLLFESIDQGFCIIEMVFNAANQPIDYRFLLTNPAFDKQTGTENAMGKTVREIAPQHEDYWFEIYGNVALTGESIRFENLAQEFHRWYEVYAFPIGEPEQRRVGILFNDITDRKRVEEARAATEQRYRIVSDLIPFGMWEADMQGSATYLSQLFLEMTGQTLEEHRQTWHTLLHPDDRQPTVAAWYECVQSGSLWEHEFRIRGKDGHYRTILARGLPVRNTAGEITSYVGANYDITDRKQAEEALRRSEERLRVSQELSLDAFTILDSVRDETGAIVDFVWTYVNPKAAEILQHPVEELVGQRLLDVLPGNQLNSELFDRYVRVVETGEPHDIELSYNADGITGWFRNMTVKLEDGIAIFFSDITERKQTEQALRVAEERLRVALQNAPIIVFNQDHELKYTWIYNPVLYELHEMLGKHDRDYLPPEDSEPLTAIKQRVLDTGIGAREEIKITRDGRNCYYDLTVEPLRDSNDTVIGITCAAIDISELKQTEINLRESEARFRGVVESNMVGIVFWDVSGCITDANEMAVQMLGYSREELQSGQTRWQDITSPEFQQIGAAMQAQLLAEGVCPPFETAYICKDGTQIPILIGGALLPGYSDRGVAYFLDITDRVQVERDRERILQQEQAAREAAEAANRIKDEFLAIVSHELRSPLNPILGWAKLLRSRQLDEQKTDRALEVIERNAQMQAQLINDLLDVSRILRGKLSLDTKPVDLIATIQAALETVRLAAEAKSIQIHTQLDPEVGQVAGDAGRLQQVIWNLLTNAVKFTSEGGRVEVRLEQVESGRVDEWMSGRVDDTPSPLYPSTHPPIHPSTPLPMHSYAQITISDTGKGIPSDFLPYVFDQFRQESSATTRRFGGLGLGLAIVRYLVELHGGTVQADSPGEGQGATFTVKLPLLQAEGGRMKDESNLPSAFCPQPSALPLADIRILVVDDDDNTREFLAFLLELHGANVIATANATEAITTLSQFKPDLLLSDIAMPDVDGYMLMRQIRALPAEQGGTIPAIALTAYAGEIDYQQAMAAGFQQHIAKPIEPQVLIRAISALCNSDGTAELRESRNG